MQNVLQGAYDTIKGKIKELTASPDPDPDNGDDCKVQSGEHIPATGGPDRPPGLERKTVFWVRHGESEWNVVQETVLKKIMSNPLKIGSVFSQFREALNQEDVRLTSEGVKQAKRTGEHFLGTRANDEQIPDAEFPRAQTIVFSPLTRTMSTGMYALQHHEYFREHGRKAFLHPGIREVRRSMNRDSVGTPKCQLADRIRETMPDLGSKTQPVDASSMVDAAPISGNIWWTHEDDINALFIPGIYEENAEAIRAQIEEFFRWLRPQPGPVIVVSHSIKIRRIMRQYGDAQSQGWGRGKVPYAAVLRTSMEWAPTADGSEPVPVIRNAELLFDPSSQTGTGSPMKNHTAIGDYFKDDGTKFSISVGQKVAVWSVNKEQWFRDGIVDKVAPDGQSIHVSYDRDSLWLGSKWISLKDIGPGSKLLQFPPFDLDENSCD